VRQQNSGRYLEQSFCREFPPVSASFRPAERRKPAAAAHVDMIDFVDESDAPDCCRRFPPFAPFPPVVFLSHPPAWRVLSPAASNSATMSSSAMASSLDAATGDAEEAQHFVVGAEQAIVMGEFAILGL
jgi:hypothetical protein